VSVCGMRMVVGDWSACWNERDIASCGEYMNFYFVYVLSSLTTRFLLLPHFFYFLIFLQYFFCSNEKPARLVRSENFYNFFWCSLSTIHEENYEWYVWKCSRHKIYNMQHVVWSARKLKYDMTPFIASTWMFF
jgi:hypothetical protein